MGEVFSASAIDCRHDDAKHFSAIEQHCVLDANNG
jgi:hypothetical protein